MGVLHSVQTIVWSIFVNLSTTKVNEGEDKSTLVAVPSGKVSFNIKRLLNDAARFKSVPGSKEMEQPRPPRRSLRGGPFRRAKGGKK